MIDQSKPGDIRGFVHKRLLRGAAGFLTGGPLAAIAGFSQSPRLPSPRRRSRPRFAPGTGKAWGRPTMPRRVVRARGVKAAVQRFLPGGATGLVVAGGAAAGGCPQGYHPNKSDYMTKAGFVAEGSKCVRNRRRNLSNGRANTRSLRRMAAWDKQERKLGKTLKAIARGR